MSDPYAPARDHLDLAIVSLAIPADRAETLRWRHEADLRSDPATGTVLYLDGSADCAAWLRGVEKSDPVLLGRAPATTASSPVAWDAMTFAQIMKAAHRDDPGAREAITVRLATGGNLPAAQKPVVQPINLTKVSIAARAGDPGALAALLARKVSN